MKVVRTIFILFFLGIMGTSFAQVSEGIALSTESIDPVKFVQLYPNPATEFVNVKLELPHAKQVKLGLHSVIGNVLSVETEIVDEYHLRLRVKDLPEGYYFLAIRDEAVNFKSTYKFLKR
jgi:hypothetical protein